MLSILVSRLKIEIGSIDITFFGVLVALYFFSTFFDFVQLGAGVSPARLTGLAIIVLSLCDGKNLLIRIDTTTALAISLITIGTISFLFLKAPLIGFSGYSSLFINLAVFISARGHVYKTKDVGLWTAALVMGGVVMCALMFLSPGAVGREVVSERTVVNIAGSQQDPNEFCGYLLFTITFFTYRSLLKNKYIYLIPVILCIYVAMLTGSRGGLLAVFVALAASTGSALKNAKHRGLTMAIAIMLTLVLLANMDMLLSMLPTSVSDRFTGASLTSGTASFRTRAWVDVLTSFANSPIILQLFGHGFGSTAFVTFNGLVAHNSIIEVLYSVGLLGLICYVGLAFISCVRARRLVPPGIAAVVSFGVLLMTLSSLSFKVFWAILLLITVVADMSDKACNKSNIESVIKGSYKQKRLFHLEQ